MKVLTVWQPWASLTIETEIVSQIKNIENRNWYTNYRGPLVIHAGKKYDKAGELWVRNKFGFEKTVKWFSTIEFHLGAVIGIVDLIDCVKKSESPWFIGEYGFVLSNPRKIIPYPYPGQQGFFEIPFQDHPILKDQLFDPTFLEELERLKG